MSKYRLLQLFVVMTPILKIVLEDFLGGLVSTRYATKHGAYIKLHKNYRIKVSILLKQSGFKITINHA